MKKIIFTTVMFISSLGLTKAETLENEIILEPETPKVIDKGCIAYASNVLQIVNAYSPCEISVEDAFHVYMAAYGDCMGVDLGSIVN